MFDAEKFSPHDAALDGTISRTDGLMCVRHCSLHPGDLGIPDRCALILVSFARPVRADLPVVDDLRVKLNLDYLTTLETKATR